MTPAEIQSLIEEATFDYTMGDNDAALAKLQRAAAAAPDSFEAWHALAEINFSLRRFDAALAAAEKADAPIALTVSTLAPTDPASDFAVGGVWRTVSWSEAAALSGDAVPRIAGLPVVEVQMQRVGPEERPLVMVAQQDPSGKIIRTIEGPVQRVAELLAGEIARSEGAVHTSEPARSAPDYVGASTGSPRRSIRVMTVAGRLDADSLNQLARSLTQR